MTKNLDIYNITLIVSIILMVASTVAYGYLLEPTYIEHLQILNK